MKRFVIKNTTLDPADWGSNDKTSISMVLTEGLKENIEGAQEAIQEVYAVTLGGDDLENNWFGPHHVIRKDGNVVLNRGGLMEAATALIGADATHSLTQEQMVKAARHLLKHFEQQEVNLRPPEALIELSGVGEMVRLIATICGEMQVNDVPLNPGIDLNALKAGDDDPMEVIVEVPAGKSKRGWDYKPEALKKIVGEVMRQGLPGIMGHQKAEDVDNQFPPPVTHWVGASFIDGKAYFRGVIDKAAADLKRWIRAGAVKTVSIFGIPTLRTVGGETQVVDYQPLSIDWTPLGRAGMPTRVVAVGEMDLINSGGVNEMTLAELLAELRKMGAKPMVVIGEMGWDFKTLLKESGLKLEEVAGEIAPQWWKAQQETIKAVGEMAGVFALGKDTKLDDLVASVKSAREVQLQTNKVLHEQLLDKVVGEMVTVETARPLVKRMLQVAEDADETEIKKVVGEMLEQEDVKSALAGVFKETPITPKTNNETNKNSGLRVKRVSI